MTISSPLRTDQDVQDAVQDELEWTPDVDAAGIGVAIEDGTVSLSGEVDSYSEKVAAKRAALRVHGVIAVVNHLVVHPHSTNSSGEDPDTDTDTAKRVAHALTWAANVPVGVKAEIEHRHVTLSGQVTWNFQREAAEHAVQNLRGVSSVRNMITLTARPTVADAKSRICKAIERNAQLDAKAIDVTVSGNSVILTGSVQSWAEKQQAGEAAWASPHVTDVDNRIRVGTSVSASKLLS